VAKSAAEEKTFFRCLSHLLSKKAFNMDGLGKQKKADGADNPRRRRLAEQRDIGDTSKKCFS